MASAALVFEPRRAAAGRLSVYGAAQSARAGATAAQYANGFRSAGICDGDRVALIGPPTAELYVVALGALWAGAVTVWVDEAPGWYHMARVLWDAHPAAVIGPRRLLRWWAFVPALSHACRYAVEGRSFGIRALADLRASSTTVNVLPLRGTEPGS